MPTLNPTTPENPPLSTDSKSSEQPMISVDWEISFQSLLLDIDNTDLRLQKARYYRRAIEEEELTLKEACHELEDFVEKRLQALFSLFTLSHTASEKERAGLAAAIRRIRELQKDRSKNFIDSGNVASIQYLENSPDLCLKIVRNFGNIYTSGNDVRKETHLLEDLEDLKIANVRVPRPLACIKTDSLHAIVMERLPAVSIRNIIEREIPLPETFRAVEFFQRIQLYLDAMHERNVFHRDLHWGNVMVNLETHEGFLVDFGTGIDLNTTSTGAKASSEEQEQTLANVDVAELEQVFFQLNQYRKKIQAPLEAVRKTMQKMRYIGNTQKAADFKKSATLEGNPSSSSV